jgi:hypothetical protein
MRSYIEGKSGFDPMTRVVFKDLNRAKASPPKGSVTEKRVRGPDGRLVKIFSIDADSPTFGDDLSYVFRKNVAKARRENKKLFGAPDRVPTKK